MAPSNIQIYESFIKEATVLQTTNNNHDSKQHA